MSFGTYKFWSRSNLDDLGALRRRLGAILSLATKQSKHRVRLVPGVFYISVLPPQSICISGYLSLAASTLERSDRSCDTICINTTRFHLQTLSRPPKTSLPSYSESTSPALYGEYRLIGDGSICTRPCYMDNSVTTLESIGRKRYHLCIYLSLH